MTDAAPKALDPAALADLAYLRQAAVAGRGRPAPAVPLMAVFGGFYGLGELVVWFEQVAYNGGDHFPDVPAPAPWDAINAVLFISAHAAFLITLVWTAWRVWRTRGAGLNRGAAAAWTAAFAGLVATVACVMLIAGVTPDPLDDALGAVLAPFVLILWGAAWWVTSVVTDRRWLGLVSVGSLVAALAAAALADTGHIKLVTALSLLLLAFLPAVILLRERRPA